MLQMYACRDGQLAPASADDAGAIWYDLLNPTLEEDKFVEKRLGVSIPTKAKWRRSNFPRGSIRRMVRSS